MEKIKTCSDSFLGCASDSQGSPGLILLTVASTAAAGLQELPYIPPRMGSTKVGTIGDVRLLKTLFDMGGGGGGTQKSHPQHLGLCSQCSSRAPSQRHWKLRARVTPERPSCECCRLGLYYLRKWLLFAAWMEAKHCNHITDLCSPLGIQGSRCI